VADLSKAVRDLQRERSRLQAQLNALDNAIFRSQWFEPFSRQTAKAQDVCCWTKANRSCTACTMGEMESC
jgi:predicted  nucleic acid-binding Zn-ribbon protein